MITSNALQGKFLMVKMDTILMRRLRFKVEVMNCLKCVALCIQEEDSLVSHEPRDARHCICQHSWTSWRTLGVQLQQQ